MRGSAIEFPHSKEDSIFLEINYREKLISFIFKKNCLLLAKPSNYVPKTVPKISKTTSFDTKKNRHKISIH